MEPGSIMEHTQFDTQLFIEVYDHHPQAILWARPIWNVEGTAIIDFEYTYSNDEGLKYLKLTPEQFSGIRVSNTPTLADELRIKILTEMIHVYETGQKSETFVFNQVLNKYAKIMRAKLRGGVLSVVEDRTAEERNLQQLEKQSHYLSNVLNTSLNAIVTLEAIRGSEDKIIDFGYKQVNHRFLQWFSKKENEVIGNTMLQLFPAARNAGVFDVYCEVIETGEPKHVEIAYQDDNKTTWFDLTVVQLDSITAVGNFNDITHRKESYDQIEKQKSLLDNILKHSSNGISVGQMIRDRNGKIVDFKTIVANDAAVQFTGIPKEDYLTKTAAEVEPTFIGSPYFHNCVECMETGTPFLTQYFLPRIERWLEVSVSKMDEEHQIYVFTDVTSIKEAQLAIERQSTKLQTIMNRTQSGIFTAAPVYDETNAIVDFRFVMVNQALAAYLNVTPEFLVDKLGSETFTGYKINGLFKLFCDTYENGTVNRFDYHYNTDGNNAWLDMMCTRFENDILVTFTDYTHVKGLQLQLESKVEELKRTNANLEEFAYAASHDLQEPLRKIHTFTERLKHDLAKQLTTAQEGVFQRIEVSTQRMRNLIEDLLAYSQLSVNPDSYAPVVLNQVMQHVLQDLETLIGESKAVIEINPLPTIKGNERQLTQLFQNLVGNAIKYRKKGVPPHVTINSKIADDRDLTRLNLSHVHRQSYYHIQVRDNGIGFDQENAERIFQVFQRLHGRSEYEGTGVGLAIVQKVVRNHEGFIWAESAPEAGAVFNLILPQ